MFLFQSRVGSLWFLLGRQRLAAIASTSCGNRRRKGDSSRDPTTINCLLNGVILNMGQNKSRYSVILGWPLTQTRKWPRIYTKKGGVQHWVAYTTTGTQMLTLSYYWWPCRDIEWRDHGLHVDIPTHVRWWCRNTEDIHTERHAHCSGNTGWGKTAASVACIKFQPVTIMELNIISDQ